MRRAVLAVVLAGLAPAPQAAAAPGLLRVLQDDATLVHGAEPRRTRAWDELPALGVDVVRINVRWADVDRDPAAWGPYDGAVRAARARGLEVLLTLTTPAPPHAAGTLGGRFRGAQRPEPAAFGRFAAAAGARYAGGPGSPGRVGRWSLINEPNNPRFLGPQRAGGRPLSPALYRALVRAGLRGLASTGHPGRAVLIGDLLATGRRAGGSLSAVGPRAFLRELLCLDGRDRPLRGAAARRHRGCAGPFAPLDMGGVAVHPYYLGHGPLRAPRRAGDLTPATLGTLRRTLRAAHRGRRVTRLPGIWDTEDGVQTSPPERLFGVALGRQARFLNEAEERLWRTPGVRSFAQYVWRDERGLRAFQSGLRFRDGRAKPALAAYRLPLVVRRVRGGGLAWGRLAPGGPATARLLLPGGSGRTVRAAGPGRAFTVRVPARRGAYRLVHGTHRSRPAALSR